MGAALVVLLLVAAWTKLSDDFQSHRAIKRAGLDGAGLFAMALSYIAKYLTDGHVDDEWLEEEVPNNRNRQVLVNRLVKLGLFERVEGGYYVPSYLRNNWSRADLEAKRAAQREGGKQGAKVRWGDRSSHRSTDGASHDDLNAQSRTRPVPVPSPTSGSEENVARETAVLREVERLKAEGVLEELS